VPGDAPDDIVVEARRGLLDALDALGPHARHVVLVGAQAVYLHTDSIVTGIALFTKDADVMLVPPVAPIPEIDAAMRAGHFIRGGQPGIWTSDGRQVDLLVPEQLAVARGQRDARLPGHQPQVARWVPGLEGAAGDNDVRTVEALDPADSRRVSLRVAGPAALLVAKAYKLADRVADARPSRIATKDAFDVYRLLQLPPGLLRWGFDRMAADPMAGLVAARGIEQLGQLFADSDARGTILAAQHVEGIGDPAIVSASVVALTRELLDQLGAA
jgi:hypothetical protein